MLKFLLYLFAPAFMCLMPSFMNAQNYEMDLVDGQVINTCSGTFYDSRIGTSDYFNNEDYMVTFCSGSSDFLRFIINPAQVSYGYAIAAGDTLRAYDGTGTSGTLLATYTSANDPGSNSIVLYSTSSCITFHWTSDAAGDADGWEIAIECVPAGCGLNPAAADNFADAPFVCDFSGFCGTTQGYTADLPFNFTGGGSCPVLFGGTIENNSWVQFEAAGPNISFQVDVIGCYGGFGGYDPTPSPVSYGIQGAILSFDGSTFTRVSDCSLSDGQNLSFNLTNTSPLTVGGTYYLVIDGSSGSICDYTINVSGDASVVDAGNDQVICSGASATLTATGPTGATYEWTELGGAVVGTGSSLSVSPTTTTQYIVEETSGGVCSSQTDTVSITVNSCGCSIDLIAAGAQTPCNLSDNTYTQEVTVTYTNAPSTGTLDINGQSFAISSSPQTVTLTGLNSDGNTVNVSASFSDNPTCTLSALNLFTAPASCSTTPCTPDNGTWD
ncbi:MAG: hypothetical protein MK212_17475 [Saprospiraceae bacterium]|nr:hypothetical protein [Saprospiraceae bacterium]